jgi:hypothetical protein
MTFVLVRFSSVFATRFANLKTEQMAVKPRPTVWPERTAFCCSCAQQQPSVTFGAKASSRAFSMRRMKSIMGPAIASTARMGMLCPQPGTSFSSEPLMHAALWRPAPGLIRRSSSPWMTSARQFNFFSTCGAQQCCCTRGGGGTEAGHAERPSHCRTIPFPLCTSIDVSSDVGAAPLGCSTCGAHPLPRRAAALRGRVFLRMWRD